MRYYNTIICASLGLALAVTAAPLASQQAWPTRPLTMIVPFAAGGSTDVIARIVADAMRPFLDQQTIVIENRGAAGGAVGTAAIARSAPDGYTIGMGSASTLAINPNVYKRLPYDVTRDLAAVIELADVPNIMAVNADLPVTDMRSFLTYAKGLTAPLPYGSAGVGSVAHLMGEQFTRAANLTLIHVPYRGMGAALADAIAGQIQIVFDNLPTTLPHVQAGKLRALAVSSPQRLPDLPAVPTFAELGLTDLDWTAFFGIVAPVGLPAPVMAKLNDAANQALANPEVARKLKEQQATVVGGSPAVFAGLIQRELARHKKTATAAGIELD